jgi:hypothetical protein
MFPSFDWFLLLGLLATVSGGLGQAVDGGANASRCSAGFSSR